MQAQAADADQAVDQGGEGLCELRAALPYIVKSPMLNRPRMAFQASQP